MGKRTLFFFNSTAVILHLILYTFSFIPPSKLSVFASVTLFIPLFITANILFLIFWLLKLNKKAFLSFATLIICFKDVRAFLGINFKEENITSNSFKIQTYNSHYFKFNRASFFELYKKLNVFDDADFIGFQECYSINDSEFEDKYTNNSFQHFKEVENHTNIATTKKVLKWGYLINSSKANKKVPFASYADLKIGAETIRFYNVHFHSYQFPKKETEIKSKGWGFFLKRLNKVFVAQEEQLKELSKHIKKSPHKIVVMGDFNNNAFSYLYKKIKREYHLKDTFVSKGNGFGKSFDFKYFPVRIDFVLVPQSAQVYSHKVTKIKNMSDHFPITTEVSF